MSLNPLHELHKRRSGRNVGLLVVLCTFIVIIFGLTMVKIQGGSTMEAFDHQPRASILPRDPAMISTRKADDALPGETEETLP